MVIFQILYWFNPVVYFAFKQMRNDREIACDAAVLDILPTEQHINYGKTLLSFIKSLSHSPAPLLATSMCGDEPQIAKRIKHISSYVSESGFAKIKNLCIFLLMILLIFCKLPFISVMAGNGDDRFHFQADNVLYQDLSHFFGGLEGSFVLYDMEHSIYTIHNRDMSVLRVPPNSTYKLISTLIGLETGILEYYASYREWDGTIHPFDSWNQNHDLTSAMQSSANWYFQDIDIQIGAEMHYNYLTQLSYRNRNTSGRNTDFWNESSLLIFPVEQVRLLTNLYQDNTTFDERHVGSLMNTMRLSESDGSVLTGKTGTGIVNDRFINGWFIGYVETGTQTFAFAAYVRDENNAGGSVAARITLSILEDKDIFS